MALNVREATTVLKIISRVLRCPACVESLLKDLLEEFPEVRWKSAIEASGIEVKENYGSLNEDASD